MKIQIDFLENKTISVGGRDIELKNVSYTNEQGGKVEATIWRFDKDNVEFPGWAEIAPGSTIEANPWSKPGSDKTTLYPVKTASNKGAGMAAMKTAQINQAMDKKAQQIHAAQDRSAWMWAKTNASTLISNTQFVKNYENLNQVANDVVELATKIYNGEPTEPFTSE